MTQTILSSQLLNFTNKDTISIKDFKREQIEYLIKQAKRLKYMEQRGKRYSLNHILKNKRLAKNFYENSTRTATSTETGGFELGMNSFGFNGPEGTSLMKRENIVATAMMYWANHADILAMRHSKDGAVQWAADVLGIPVINCGDGKNEHPTQALLDMVTIDELIPGIHGANIGFGGDLAHGRTVRSNCLALSLFNDITIHWAADNKLAMPEDLIRTIEKRGVKVKRYKSVEDVLRNSDAYYMTRPQIKRMKRDDGSKYSDAEINSMLDKYKITVDKLLNSSKCKILHPLPVDSAIGEIDFKVFFSDKQYFFAQAENGVFLRKALLYETLNNAPTIIYNSVLDEKISQANNRKKLSPGKKKKDCIWIILKMELLLVG